MGRPNQAGAAISVTSHEIGDARIGARCLASLRLVSAQPDESFPDRCSLGTDGRGVWCEVMERCRSVETHERPAPIGSAGMDLAALSATSLIDDTGEAHRLGELWRDRPIVLVFLRHFG